MSTVPDPYKSRLADADACSIAKPADSTAATTGTTRYIPTRLISELEWRRSAIGRHSRSRAARPVPHRQRLAALRPAFPHSRPSSLPHCMIHKWPLFRDTVKANMKEQAEQYIVQADVDVPIAKV